jgi:hypothetical protein
VTQRIATASLADVGFETWLAEWNLLGLRS